MTESADSVHGRLTPVKDWIARTIDRPVVAHAMSANTRYGQRLGAQFAAGVTYFSVLSIVPVLMVAFAATGVMLTVIAPDALVQIKDAITSAVGGQGEGQFAQFVLAAVLVAEDHRFADHHVAALDGRLAARAGGLAVGVVVGGDDVGDLGGGVLVLHGCYSFSFCISC